MQRYTIFFITADALNVSGGLSTHHQELKNCTHSIWYVPDLLLLLLGRLGWNARACYVVWCYHSMFLSYICSAALLQRKL
jgi:hypothetical protein